MAQIKTVNWWIVCKDCGKRANRITRPENAVPPMNTPSMPGKKPELTRLADFDYWKNKGAFVKPGQSSLSILESHSRKHPNSQDNQ